MTPVEPAAEPLRGPTTERYADLARRILDRSPRLGPTRLVAVDGPSGAGKSHFADRLSVAAGGAPVLRTDDLLDGWADQFSFWHRLEEWVLGPLRAGRPGGYRRYDWHRAEFGRERVMVPPAPLLILEGVSAARATTAADRAYAVFVTAPSALRRQRTIDRDGPAILPQLDIWRRAEFDHFEADDTANRVDLVVDGAPSIAHDSATEYVRIRRSTAES